MIPFDFIYFRPETLKEATEIYNQLNNEGKKAVYFAGGSETITMCRSNAINPYAVIDIKNIPECHRLVIENDYLVIGSLCTLNEINFSGLFKLLGLSCSRIADHTNQCRITIGGNLYGTIIYRETSLPLLLSDADITIYGLSGSKTVPFNSIFDGKLNLKSGEIIVEIKIPLWATKARFFHIKKTQSEKIDYPLDSMSAICKDDFIRVAFSGICSYPFRSNKIETIINNHSLSCNERAEKASEVLPENPYQDVEGSSEYRKFVFIRTLEELLEEWEHDKI